MARRNKFTSAAAERLAKARQAVERGERHLAGLQSVRAKAAKAEAGEIANLTEHLRHGEAVPTSPDLEEARAIKATAEAKIGAAEQALATLIAEYRDAEAWLQECQAADWQRNSR